MGFLGSFVRAPEVPETDGEEKGANVKKKVRTVVEAVPVTNGRASVRATIERANERIQSSGMDASTRGNYRRAREHLLAFLTRRNPARSAEGDRTALQKLIVAKDQRVLFHDWSLSKRTQSDHEDALRYYLEELCRAGLTDLSWSRCVIPVPVTDPDHPEEQPQAKDPHRPEQVQRGLEEALLGIFPWFLIPENRRKVIVRHRGLPPRVVEEFRRVVRHRGRAWTDSNAVKYLELLEDFVFEVRVRSLTTLAGRRGARRVMGWMIRRGFSRGSDVIRDLQSLFKFLGEARVLPPKHNPFQQWTKTGYRAIDFHQLPDTPKRTRLRSIEDEVCIRVGDEWVPDRLPQEELAKIEQHLLTWPDHPESHRCREGRAWFGRLQEDLIVKVLAGVTSTQRAADLLALNVDQFTETVRVRSAFKGKIVRSNYRPSRTKRRGPKGWPDALLEDLDRLLALRAVVFAAAGRPDMTPSKPTGTLKAGAALFVNPKNGARLTYGLLRKTIRRALERMKIREPWRTRATVTTFRRTIETELAFDGVSDASRSSTMDHTKAVGLKHYQGRDALRAFDEIVAKRRRQPDQASPEILGTLQDVLRELRRHDAWRVPAAADPGNHHVPPGADLPGSNREIVRNSTAGTPPAPVGSSDTVPPTEVQRQWVEWLNSQRLEMASRFANPLREKLDYREMAQLLEFLAAGAKLVEHWRGTAASGPDQPGHPEGPTVAKPDPS